MNGNKKKLGAAIAATLIFPAASLAQVDTSDWKCEYCPFDDGYRAQVNAGVDYVSDDAARFGNGTGYDEKGAYLDLDGAGRYRKDGTDISWYAEDLGLDSRVLSISAGRPGKYKLGLDYRELPYRQFDTTSTIFIRSGADTLTLPTGWVPATTTDGFTALNDSLYLQNIEKDRQTLQLSGEYLPTRNLNLFAD